MESKEFSYDALLEFVRDPSRSDVKAATAKNWLSTCERLRSVVPQDSDVRKLDVDGLIAAYQRDNSVGEASLRTYRSRMNSAIKKFLNQTGSQPRPTICSHARSEADLPKKKSAESDSIDDKLIAFPVPLREGLIVELKLPINLTEAEAEKISSVVKVLAMSSK